MMHLDVLNDQVMGVETLVLGVALGLLGGIDNVIKSLPRAIVSERGYVLYNVP